MILLAPDDRVFTTAGVSYAKGDRIDVADLAARLGVDPDGLAADLLAQGFTEAKPAKTTATKKAAKTTATKKAAKTTAPDGANPKES